MNLKLTFHAIFISFILLCSWTDAQTSVQDNWVNGYSRAVSGDVRTKYGFNLESDSVLFTRYLKNFDPIEWETDTVAADNKDSLVTFIWAGAYSFNESAELRTFSLFTNNKYQLSFTTASKTTDGDWSVKGKTSELEFKKVKIVNNNEFGKEIWGYFLLTIPRSELETKNYLKIKIKGDGSVSRHYYVTMEHALAPKIKITGEKIVFKEDDGKTFQRVRVSILHFSAPKPVKILSDGKEVVSASLEFGENNFYIKYEPQNSPVHKNIEVDLYGKTIKRQITINPVKNITFYLIPEAHVDIGYTELQSECEKKHWRNFDEAIKLSKQSADYPAESVFKWNVEVLWAVEGYLAKFPEKRAQFIEAVKKGWINLDANYANLLTGLCRPEELYKIVDCSNKLEKLTGTKIESAMISDVPGYTWGLVQVYADNGIKYFSVGPNATDRLGGTLKVWGDKPFYWKSPSGENKVLVWVTKKGYSWFHKWRLTAGDVTPVLKYIDDLEADNYPYDMVHLRYNIGGDNGFPDSLLSDFVKKWNEQHETPKFVISSTDQMFKDFERKYSAQISKYSGDFTPYWEDGAGSTARETAMNRNTAELLTQLETLYTIKGKNIPKEDFDEAWENVLLYSEHTWGANSSITEPEKQFVKDQWEVKKSFALKADSIVRELYKGLALGNTSELVGAKNFRVYNTTSWKRTDLVTIPSTLKVVGDCVVDENGIRINTQRLSTGDLIFVAKDVPALGSRQYAFTKNNSSNIMKEYDSPNKQETSLSNDLYHISVNEENGSFNLAYTNSKQVQESAPGIYDSLNSFIHTGTNAENPQTNGPVKIIMKENGPVVSSLVIESDAPGCNSLTREIKLYKGLDKIEITNTVDKTKNYKKENLRFAFPFNIQNPVTRIDIAWAVIQPEKDQLDGANKNFFTAQRWVDVSNDSRGITLATIDAPFLELGGMTAENWNLNQNEENWATSTASSSIIYSWVMNNSWHTNYKASQEGITAFKYALLPHSKFDYSKTYRFGVEQSQPLIVTFADNTQGKSLFNLDDTTKIVVTSIKSSQDGKWLIIKFYNPTNEYSSSRINFNGKARHKLYLSNGKEENISELNGRIELKPYAVKIIKLENN